MQKFEDVKSTTGKYGPGFRKSSNRVYIYEPTIQNGSSHRQSVVSQAIQQKTTTTSPTTILIFGWADAHPRHLTKYTDMYKEIYPSSRIIIVTAETMATFYGGQKAAMNTVQDVVLTELFPTLSTNTTTTSTETAKQEHLLIQAFSNSGAINLEAACNVYSQHSPTPTPMPYTALILDSTPSGHFFWTELPRWARGINIGFSRAFPWPASFSLYIAYVWVLCTMGLPMLFGVQNTASRVKAWVNNTETSSTSAQRLYMYSDSDSLINYHDVEEHAAEAAAIGYPVQLHKFSGSEHCSHARKFPEEYWGVVKRFWDMAVEKEEE